ncbi:MAG: hypothetical protein NDJ90_00170 [Oligoflexia bacterium]|nr:hypothetical protein [Oligoflexia bacterium]
MTRRPTEYSHGPDNAEHELKKAYNCVIESNTTYRERTEVSEANPQEVEAVYRQAFRAYRKGDRLAAERWARTAKHLARALWHEAKIAYLEPRGAALPYLEGASAEEYNLHEHSDTTEDLLNSVADHVPSPMTEMPEQMTRFLNRGREHLEALRKPEYRHELLRAERIKAAHEYGRVLECMALAYEAEAGKKAA